MGAPEGAGDPRFYARAGPHSLAVVTEAARGKACGKASGRDLILDGVAPLQLAGPRQVSFFDNRKYLAALSATRAGAVLVRPAMARHVPPGTVAIETEEPYVGWARVAALFHPPPPAEPGVHPTASISPGAEIDDSAEIGPLVVVGDRAEIGARCRIGAGAVIGRGVVIGPDCRIGTHVSISHTLMGARVTVYPGARIGQDGFGFTTGPEGFRSIPQLGRVVLEDDVEVGANTTIDRGSLHDTRIGAGSRLDNLVQIGHNVEVGRGCVIVAQVGISGSTVLEDHVMIGGQAGLTGHLRVGRRARIGAQAGVMADVEAGSEVVGTPATPVREFFRQIASLRRLARRDRDLRGADETEAG